MASFVPQDSRATIVSENPASRARRGKRGSALITVILMLLVLTVVGVGVAYLTQVEDRITGNDRYLKSAFYAAETGLRVGEAAILGTITNPSQMGPELLVKSGLGGPNGNATPNLVLPGGGRNGRVLSLGGIEYSPAVSTTCCSVAPITVSGVPDGQVTQARYTLYVRNNPDDPSGTETDDQDGKVNLISVGQVLVGVTTPVPVAITKILEEQISLARAGTQSPDQKGGFSSGSSGGTVG